MIRRIIVALVNGANKEKAFPKNRKAPNPLNTACFASIQYTVRMGHIGWEILLHFCCNLFEGEPR